MIDRSSRPHRGPARTPQPQVRRIVHLRWKQRLGPVRIAGRLGMPASTVHAILTRCRINRLSHIDRLTGEPVRRYEDDHPGAMLHIDVKKLGNVPDGGGWRYVGRVQGRRNRAATPDRPRNKYRGPLLGTAFVHTVVDDHSRVAYAEIRDDETAATAVDVLHRAVDWFAARGVSIERVLTDNGSAYRSRHWSQACAELGITLKKARPYRPQTNGRVNASTAPWLTDGPWDASTPANQRGRGRRRCCAGANAGTQGGACAFPGRDSSQQVGAWSTALRSG
jgi:transposase InsO family protein